MKIGILTYHRGVNYGAFLQAWSLFNFISKNFDSYEVEIIDYQSEECELAEKRVFLPRWKRDWFIKSKIFKCVKYYKFKFWQWRYFNIRLKPIRNINLISCDLVIFGSDEIWNISNWYNKIDTVYFGFGLKDGINKVAFAPSMGSANFEKFESSIKILNLIREFKKISVRDVYSSSILDRLGIKSDILLDPTFLIDWQEILKKYQRPLSENYILLNINHEEQFQSILPSLMKMAAEKNLKVLNLVYTNSMVGTKNIMRPNPFEWVNYFKFAEHVITDTFHGCVFAINTRRDFTIISPGEKKNKIEGILSSCGIKRVFKNYDINFELDSIIDYNFVNELISEKINNSQKFLLNI
jgi:hypothetical protein